MTSPVSKRAAPQKNFENYVLTRQVSEDVGLFPLSYDNFFDLPGTGTTDDYLSNLTSLGFELEFNNRIYNKFVVSSNGWVALVDKTQTSFSVSDVLYGSHYENDGIKPSFSNNHILLCVWFDDLKGVPNYDTTGNENYALGIDLPSRDYNPVVHSQKGARCAYTTAPNGERCTILRWKSYTWYTSMSTQIEFDAVIYESGKIEFRYAPKTTVGAANSSEGATIGIFVNNGGWNFRDFTENLGYRDNERNVYRLGGYTYDSSYTDTDGSTVTYYTFNINATYNWPGAFTSGCIFTFSPPQNRKKILPRIEQREIDARISSPLPFFCTDVSKFDKYDDRNTVNYTNYLVDFPSTLPRLHGNGTSRIAERQNIFGEFEVNGLITRSGTENFVGNKSITYIAPFSENKILEAGLTGSFYSGSSVESFGLALKQPLRSKTQIKLSLPIHYSINLFETGSSIYYYNTSRKGFFMPRGTSATDFVPDPSIYITSISYAEDGRGFGALGNSLSSGSSASAISAGSRWQSTDYIGVSTFQYDMEDQIPVLTTLFQKSVQNNSSYDPQSGEQFTLPINSPFLIEKAIFEIPFTMGDGWFTDKTSSGSPLTTTNTSAFPIQNNGIDWRIFDIGGPAITVALYNQTKTVNNNYRDLILTGTIIPQGDNNATIKIYETKNNSSGMYDRYVFTPEGFLSYGVSPSNVISPNNGLEFTGSVSVPCVAGISNGLILSWLDSSTNGSDNSGAQMTTNRNYAKSILTSKYVPVNYGFGGSYAFSAIKDIDTFGRNQKAASPSGRSIFGKEFVTTQKTQDPKNGGYFKNPLYVSASYEEFPTYIKNAIQSSSVGFVFNTAINLQSVEDSPYLVMPGDKLTLAISKTRPRIFSKGTNPLDGNPQDYYLNSGRHNVSIMTGTIHVTLFGSFMSYGEEYHQGNNQRLGSNVVRGVIGDEPVLDQFEVEYDGVYNGSYTDDYITGSLLIPVQIQNKTVLKPGVDYYQSRGKVFSKVNASLKSTPDTSTYEVGSNPSKSFRLQPWFERVGTQRTLAIDCSEERYYDSLMPSIPECFHADNSVVFTIKNISSFISPVRILDDVKNGFVFLDGKGATSNEDVLYNNNWTWSYPFQPRYYEAPRMLDFMQSFVTKTAFNGSTGNIEILPRKIPITKLYPVMFKRGDAAGNYQLTGTFGTDFDHDAGGWVNMNPADISKCMFGFGDVNTITYDSSGNNRAGNNHLPEFREYTNSANVSYGVGPVIRGWKYGVINAMPTYSKCVWRRGHFGQFRDMLEQRLDTKFYVQPTEYSTKGNDIGKKLDAYNTDSPVIAKFLDSDGNLTNPENTWCHNLSLEATSSMPYFDGEAMNRPEIVVNAVNLSNTVIVSDKNGNLTI